MDYESIKTTLIDYYDYLLEYIENGDENFYNLLISSLEQSKIPENHDEMKLFLCLLSSISQNHHRNSTFLTKIEKIISYFSGKIKQNFPNTEIFNIFMKSKRIIWFLCKQKILNPDDSFLEYFKNKGENYILYFYKQVPEFEQTFPVNDQSIFDEYETKCQIGENDSYIASLIRDDSIKEFIVYCNQHNFEKTISSQINDSFYGTNSFLIDKTPTLLEYSAFFGSINIFQFLRMNNVRLTPSLWMYAIHGNNADIIHLLEENQIQPEDPTYLQCFEESIKCHHNSIANYIQDNLLNNLKPDFDSIFCSFYLGNYNFSFLQETISESIFLYACKYDYFTLVRFILNNGEIQDINVTLIHQINFFIHPVYI